MVFHMTRCYYLLIFILGMFFLLLIKSLKMLASVSQDLSFRMSFRKCQYTVLRTLNISSRFITGPDDHEKKCSTTGHLCHSSYLYLLLGVSKLSHFLWSSMQNFTSSKTVYMQFYQNKS